MNCYESLIITALLTVLFGVMCLIEPCSSGPLARHQSNNPATRMNLRERGGGGDYLCRPVKELYYLRNRCSSLGFVNINQRKKVVVQETGLDYSHPSVAFVKETCRKSPASHRRSASRRKNHRRQRRHNNSSSNRRRQESASAGDDSQSRLWKEEIGVFGVSSGGGGLDESAIFSPPTTTLHHLVRYRHHASKRYVCFDRKGRVRAVSRRKVERKGLLCLFEEQSVDGSFHTIRSVYNPYWYLAFNYRRAFRLKPSGQQAMPSRKGNNVDKSTCEAHFHSGLHGQPPTTALFAAAESAPPLAVGGGSGMNALSAPPSSTNITSNLNGSSSISGSTHNNNVYKGIFHQISDNTKLSSLSSEGGHDDREGMISAQVKIGGDSRLSDSGRGSSSSSDDFYGQIMDDDNKSGTNSFKMINQHLQQLQNDDKLHTDNDDRYSYRRYRQKSVNIAVVEDKKKIPNQDDLLQLVNQAEQERASAAVINEIIGTAADDDSVSAVPRWAVTSRPAPKIRHLTGKVRARPSRREKNMLKKRKQFAADQRSKLSFFSQQQRRRLLLRQNSRKFAVMRKV